MPATPPRFDMWVVAHLALLMGQHPALDRAVEYGVATNLLGGVWYAAALSVFWVQGAQPGRRAIRLRTLTVLVGSAVAAALTIPAMIAISWAPPSAHPELAGFYPESFGANLNPTSFPSQSTALYAAVAAGLYSLRRTVGVWAWAGVGVLVAVPRIYLGGHYLTDVLGGLAMGLVGYWIAVSLLEARLVSRLEIIFEHEWDDWRRTLAEFAVFLWILLFAVEFRWVRDALEGLWS
jgi:membrane-associated phospholipid phosphatase